MLLTPVVKGRNSVLLSASLGARLHPVEAKLHQDHTH